MAHNTGSLLFRGSQSSSCSGWGIYDRESRYMLTETLQRGESQKKRIIKERIGSMFPWRQLSSPLQTHGPQRKRESCGNPISMPRPSDLAVFQIWFSGLTTNISEPRGGRGVFMCSRISTFVHPTLQSSLKDTVNYSCLWGAWPHSCSLRKAYS